jgi:H+-transporting ATPase
MADIAHNGMFSKQSITTTSPHSFETNSSQGEIANEKHELPDVAAAKPHHGDKGHESEEEDEDMDALIDELESQDGQEELQEEEEEAAAGDTPPIAEEYLQTSTRTGLTAAEVITRRKKFGLNQMKEEKENLVLKFLGYFIGPIQFVMEVCSLLCHFNRTILLLRCSIELATVISTKLIPLFSTRQASKHKSSPASAMSQVEEFC